MSEFNIKVTDLMKLSDKRRSAWTRKGWYVRLQSKSNRNGTTYLLKSPKGRLLYFAIANDGRRYKKCDHMRAWAAQGQARVDKDFSVR